MAYQALCRDAALAGSTSRTSSGICYVHCIRLMWTHTFLGCHWLTHVLAQVPLDYVQVPLKGHDDAGKAIIVDRPAGSMSN